MNSCLLTTVGAHFFSSILLAPSAFFPLIYWLCEPVWGFATSVCVSTFISYGAYSLSPIEKLSNRPKLFQRFNRIREKIALFSPEKKGGVFGKILYLSLLIPLVFAPPLMQGLLIRWAIASKVKSFIVLGTLQLVANGIVFGSLLLGYSLYETFDPTIFL